MTFIDGLEQSRLRINLTHTQLDSMVQDLVLSFPMAHFEQGRVRILISNEDTPMEDVATWILLDSKLKGGLKDNNRKSGNIEEVDCVEIKKNIDLTYQIEEQAKKRKQKETKDRVHSEYSQMSASQRRNLAKMFTGGI